jgi:hypothetical protein
MVSNSIPATRNSSARLGDAEARMMRSMIRLMVRVDVCRAPATLGSAVVIQVHRFMPGALAEILRKAPLTEEKIAFAWRASVGAAMDRGTTVVLENGVLRVRADSAAWRREVERSEALIRARLDVLLGRGIVRSIAIDLT